MNDHRDLINAQAEKMAAVRAERASEDRFALLVEAAKDYAIIITNPEGQIITWNTGAQHLTGWTTAEAVGKHLSILHAKNIDEAIESDLLEKVRSHGRIETEGWRNRKDGTRFWADTITSALHNDTGEIRGFSEITRDLTERMAHEQELLALNNSLEKQVKERTSELEAANKELEAFSYSVSHDLRAPLRAIDGFAKALMEDYAPNLDSELVHYLETISRNAVKMGNLIDDLLAFSRLGKLPLVLTEIDMTSLTKIVFEEALAANSSVSSDSTNSAANSNSTELHKIKLNLKELPSVTADKNLLRQVLVNLLSNAIKFSVRQELAQISVWAEQSNDETVYHFQDNGVGFDMRFVDKLFTPFQRLHRTKDFAGTGIGLALCRRILARHNGRIWAKSESGQGTTVSFALPALPATNMLGERENERN